MAHPAHPRTTHPPAEAAPPFQARLCCRRSLTKRLEDLAALVLRRFSSGLGHKAVSGFDLTSGSGDGQFPTAALLDRFSALSGQVHVLSDDPWRFLWAPGRCAFLPFHERPSALIAWRDPVGPAETSTHLVELFRAYAARRGKHAVLLGVSRSVVQALPRNEFQSVWLGSEPFYDLATWHTHGKAGMEVRQACNHARRLGAAAREAHPLDDVRDRVALQQVADAWMAARPERRSRSFLRTAPLENARHRRYFVVEGDERVESFLVCSSVSRRGQYLQDLVRRPDALRGANELAVVTAMAVFQREGLDFVTGGIVPFFDPNRPRRNQLFQEGGMLGSVIRHFDHLFRFSGLQQFRAKFAPSRVVDIYALLWPGVLTPALAWDIRSVLG